MFSLPQVLLNEIYSYDDTYKNIFTVGVLDELKEESLYRWRNKYNCKFRNKLDFVFDYLFDIWKTCLKKEQIDNIFISSYSPGYLYIYRHGEVIMEEGDYDPLKKMHILINLGKHRFEGFVYDKQNYFEIFVHGENSINMKTETVYENENSSLYLVEVV